MCCSKIPPTPPRQNQQSGGYQCPQGQNQSQHRVRQIQENLIEEEQNDLEETESVDPESALYIRELTEDWTDVNHISPRAFSPMKNTTLNEITPKEIWVETATSDKHIIHWPADTESPRSFITLGKTEEIIKNNPKLILQPYNSQTQY